MKWKLGLYGGYLSSILLGDIMVPNIGFRALMMENQMEKKLENEMEAGII